MKIWLVMIAIGLITYATRLSFILLLGKIEMPMYLKRALQYVPPAVLSAIIFPELLMPQGKLDISGSNLRMLAGIIAFAVAWRTKSALLTIIIGMATLLLLQSLV